VPSEHLEHKQDSLKVWCTQMKDKVIDFFSFCELTITSNVFLDMLENYIMPYTEEDITSFSN
jgi:hypothetical protein